MRRSTTLSWLCALSLIELVNACADAPAADPGALAAEGGAALYAAGSGATATAGLIAAGSGGAGRPGGAGAAAGPAGTGAAGLRAPDIASCPDGFPRGSAAIGSTRSTRRIAPETPSPEGVTVCPDGEVFVARDASGEVWHVPLDGTPQELWAALGDRRPAGITCDDQGRLFVAIFAAKSGKEDVSLGPVLITGKGATPLELPQPIAAAKYAGLNGIVAVPGIGVYTSDTGNNNIVLLRESASGVFAASVVASDVSLANGLAYSKAKQLLYANASGAWELLQFRVARDGALSERKSVEVPFMLFMDGVAVDERGELYVADWLGGGVISVSTGHAVMNVATPASLAFRGGTLLATDYKLNDPNAEGGLYAADLGVCGGL